jgi:hypothetical protein
MSILIQMAKPVLHGAWGEEKAANFTPSPALSHLPRTEVQRKVLRLGYGANLAAFSSAPPNGGGATPCAMQPRPGRLGLVKNALDAGPGKNRNYSYLTYHGW